VSGVFKVPGMDSPLSFDLTQIFAGSKKNKGPNNNNLGLIAQYNSSTISNAPSPDLSGFGSSFTGSPTSSSAGGGRAFADAASFGVAGGQSASLATLSSGSPAVSPSLPSGSTSGGTGMGSVNVPAGVIPQIDLRNFQIGSLYA